MNSGWEAAFEGEGWEAAAGVVGGAGKSLTVTAEDAAPADTSFVSGTLAESWADVIVPEESMTTKANGSMVFIA